MENKTATQDRRITKTKKAIRNAFAELLSKKDINSITIKDIADTADINRKTFYNYYKGVYELMDEIENELVALFELTLQDIDFRASLENPYLIFEKLTSLLNSDLDFYAHLLTPKNNGNLIAKAVTTLKIKSQAAFITQIDVDKEVLSIALDYAITGMLAIYQQWFNSDKPQSLEEISHIASTMCFSGLSGIVTQHRSR